MKSLIIIMLFFISVKLNAQQPVLYTPENGAMGQSVTPTLTFSNCPCAGGYHRLEICTNTGFVSGIIYTKNFAYSPLNIPSGTLTVNNHYYWRVSVINGEISYPPSDIWQFTTSATSVSNISEIIPEAYKLYNNYPNPFNPTTKIKFDLPKESFVKINIFDVTGRIINELVNMNLNAGTYETEFSGGNLSNGIYYYRIETNDFADTKKMILIK